VKHRCLTWLLIGGAVVALAAEPAAQFRPPVNGQPPARIPVVARRTAAPARSVDSGRTLQIDHCLIAPDADIQVPALESGPLVLVDVQENALVQKGQLLARLDDRKSRLEMIAAEKERDAALKKATDDIETRYSQAAYEVEDAELEKLMAAKSRLEKSVSDSEVRRVRLNRHKAELQIERSKLERQIAQLAADVHDSAVKQAQDAVNRRQIMAPIDGMVVTLFRREGEWVNAGEPVVQLVKMDTLRVEGFVSASDYDVVDLADREVTVEVELAGQRPESFTGRVTVISPLVQAGNKYRVRAEVTNRAESGHWLLRPGMNARLTIHLQ
jgi:multidrug efflux pump subunit AcrA (membrane-fusion protein)